eukprot:464383_1
MEDIIEANDKPNRPNVSFRQRDQPITIHAMSREQQPVLSVIENSPLTKTTSLSIEHSHSSIRAQHDSKRRLSTRASHLNVVQRPFAKWFSTRDWEHPQKLKIKIFLESNAIQVIMILLTFYVLYAEDFRLAFAEPSLDEEFGIIAFVITILFFTELFLLCYSIKNYFLSFFFILDLIAAISLIFDIEFLMRDTVLAGGAGANQARAGRAARAGTKAGRIVRLVRLIRLANVIKFFKRNQSDVKDDRTYDEFEDSKQYEPTKLGTFLSQMMTKKVILAVLSMIFVLPYLQNDNSDKFIDIKPSIQRLNDWVLQPTVTADQRDLVIDSFIEQHNDASLDKNLIYLEVNDAVYLDEAGRMHGLRASEVEKISVSSKTFARFDVKQIRVNDALKSIASTSFLVFMLAALAMAFTRDTEKYVVTPIRDMTNAIRNLASYEKAMKLMNKKRRSKKSEQFGKLIKRKRQLNNQSRRTIHNTIKTEQETNDDEEAEEEILETDMMQGTIRKLARLLELGFGVAGQEIVRKIISSATANEDENGRQVRTRTSKIDFTNIGGTMMNGIFGFCIVRDFNTTLQVLQGETMIYVNSIAHIVHSIVHKYSGAANKNIGNAFLCVWKLPQLEKYDENGIDLNKQNLADQALLAFLKIIIEIRSNKEIQRYAKIAEIKRILPDWKVSLGFGLHYGWAIEGAIGSKHKIDASYLSPNVNLAARLESGTHQFHVDLLLSDCFVQLLSPTARSLCREIDCVKVKGSAVPIGLWTYDLIESKQDHGQDEELEKKHSDEVKEKTSQISISDLSHQMRGVNENPDENESIKMTKWEKLFLNDMDLTRYRRNLHPQFRSTFKNAFLHYVEGRWDVAKNALLKCKQMYAEDGPTNVLLNVLAKYEDKAPKDWDGNRSLTSK